MAAALHTCKDAPDILGLILRMDGRESRAQIRHHVHLINGVIVLVFGVGVGVTSERLLCFGCSIYDDWLPTELQL